MINWQQIHDLKSDLGEDAFPDLIPVFLAEVEDIIASLATAEGVSETNMHLLKGTALTLGFSDLGQRAFQAEMALRNNETATVDVPGILSAYKDENDEFLAWLAR